jgi:hypothetical protein
MSTASNGSQLAKPTAAGVSEVSRASLPSLGGCEAHSATHRAGIGIHEASPGVSFSTR